MSLCSAPSGEDSASDLLLFLTYLGLGLGPFHLPDESRGFPRVLRVWHGGGTAIWYFRHLENPLPERLLSLKHQLAFN